MEIKVLVVEDDKVLNDALCYNLQKNNMIPFSACDIEEANKYLQNNEFELIILDINLPDGNGFDFAIDLSSLYNIPFIFLTGYNLEEDIIKGLKIGADDYITKPFSIDILMEKIQVVLRRCYCIKKIDIFKCGKLIIDFEKYSVKKDDEIITLTPTEFKILELLCKNKGRVLTKRKLLESIWDVNGNYVNEHTVSLNVSRLRNKISDDKNEYIKTIYGLGYKWIGEVK